MNELLLLKARIRLLRAALEKMLPERHHIMDPSSFECEAEEALWIDDVLGSTNITRTLQK
jgi:hypothetical protein